MQNVGKKIVLDVKLFICLLAVLRDQIFFVKSGKVQRHSVVTVFDIFFSGYEVVQVGSLANAKNFEIALFK